MNSVYCIFPVLYFNTTDINQRSFERKSNAQKSGSFQFQTTNKTSLQHPFFVPKKEKAHPKKLLFIQTMDCASIDCVCQYLRCFLYEATLKGERGINSKSAVHPRTNGSILPEVRLALG